MIGLLIIGARNCSLFNHTRDTQPCAADSLKVELHVEKEEYRKISRNFDQFREKEDPED